MRHSESQSAVTVIGSDVRRSPVESGSSSIVADGSVDLRGRPVSSATTGGWKACFFIFGQEVAERIAYYGIAANLFVYLTTQLREGVAQAAKNVNNWNGTVFLLPFLGAFLADAYLGRYWTTITFSSIYIVAACMLTAAVSVRSLRPPACPAPVPGAVAVPCPKASKAQFGFFYFALYFLALGNGGMKPCVSALGADQFDEEKEEENKQKLSFFNWWYVAIGVGILFSITVVVYVQDNVGWGWGYGIPTLALVLGMVVFLSGTPLYRHQKPVGSPMTQFAQVVVAAVRKWRLPVPLNGELLHEDPVKHYLNSGRRRVLHTNTLRFLDKAATYNPNSGVGEIEGKTSPWRLCTVTQVEEIKVFVRMVPIWVTNLMFQTVYAQSSTLFVKQALTLDLRLGPHFTIPAASFSIFSVLPYLITIVVYDRLLMPVLRRWTGHPRGVPILVKIGAGLFLSILAMVAASLTERRRQNFARDHDVVDSPTFLHMSGFWLLPQYIIMSVADSLAIVGEMEFFYEQAPDHMKSLGTAFFLSLMGTGSFLSSVLIDITNNATSRNGKHPWFGNNLNRSRLDKFYWMLAVLSSINLVAYIFFAYTFSSRTTASQVAAPVDLDEVDPDRI